MTELILYLVTLLIVYLIYFLLIIKRKKTLEKYRTSTEVRFLEVRYQLDIDQMAITNAFIIATTVTIVSFIPKIIWKLVVGFVILIPMILVAYHFLGIYYQKKYRKQERGKKHVS